MPLSLVRVLLLADNLDFLHSLKLLHPFVQQFQRAILLLFLRLLRLFLLLCFLHQVHYNQIHCGTFNNKFKCSHYRSYDYFVIFGVSISTGDVLLLLNVRIAHCISGFWSVSAPHSIVVFTLQHAQ